MSRYATKKFDGRKIPEEKVGELLELVRFAPSAINLQPWKIKIVTDQKVKEQAEAGDAGPGADHVLLAPAGLLREPGLRQPDRKGRAV